MEEDIISISTDYFSGSGNDCWVNCLNERHQEQWTHPHKHCSSAGSLQDKWPAARIQMNPPCSHSARWADSCGCWSRIRPHLQKKNKGDCVWNDGGRERETGRGCMTMRWRWSRLSEVIAGQDLYVIVPHWPWLSPWRSSMSQQQMDVSKKKKKHSRN